MEEQYQRLAEILQRHIPARAVPLATSLLIDQPIELKIKRSRSSKQGDYRPPVGKQGHRISVNGDLNPYAFLITLIHELAHYFNWIRYQNRIKPHGVEWQQEFRLQLTPFLNDGCFPEDLTRVLRTHLAAATASSHGDPHLRKVLLQYDRNPEKILLEDIPEGTVFYLNGKRIFQKGKRLRTRFKCLDLVKKRFYLISAIAEVEPVNSQA